MMLRRFLNSGWRLGIIALGGLPVAMISLLPVYLPIDPRRHFPFFFPVYIWGVLMGGFIVLCGAFGENSRQREPSVIAMGLFCIYIYICAIFDLYK